MNHKLGSLLLASTLASLSPLSAAVVINYSGNGYVTTTTTLNRTITSNLTTYTGGAGRSEVLAFSESTALSPASGYSGPIFHGGWYRSGAGATGTNGSNLRRIVDNAGFDYIDATFAYYTASGASSTEGAFALVFKKENFTNLSATPNLTFETGSSLSINIQGVSRADARWLVKDGDTYYVSNVSYNTTGIKTLASPGDTTWAVFDPASSLNFTPGSFTAHAFSDIQAVGYYAQSNTPGVDTTATYFRVNAFSASLAPIPEPSAFAALAGLGALGLVALRRRRS